MEKQYSKEATRLLKTLQNLQDDFAEIMGAIIVTVDKNGDLVTEMSGLPEACKMIRETEGGLAGCEKDYHAAVSMAGKYGEVALIKCHAGFVALYIPISVDGKLVGAITGCGGLYRGLGEDELRENYSKIAERYGIADSDEFIRRVLHETKVASEEEIKRRISLISTSIETLVEETPLKEVFTA